MGCRRLWHSKGLLWPRPALKFSRTLLDALADLRTATPIYLAALKVVEELQFTDHPTARKFDTKRTVRSVGHPRSASRRQIITVGNCPVPDVNRVRDVRDGSISSFWPRTDHFRSSPTSGHFQISPACPKSAKGGSNAYSRTFAASPNDDCATYIRWLC